VSVSSTGTIRKAGLSIATASRVNLLRFGSTPDADLAVELAFTERASKER
jgi:hypothetical protein